MLWRKSKSKFGGSLSELLRNEFLDRYRHSSTSSIRILENRVHSWTHAFDRLDTNSDGVLGVPLTLELTGRNNSETR
jgi:hypothetical protein